MSVRERLIGLPVIVQLALAGSLAMLIPAGHAAAAAEWAMARIFLHSAIGCTLLLVLVFSINVVGDRLRQVLNPRLAT